jgi:hypothetical protein
LCRTMDGFAEPVIARIRATRWLAMTQTSDIALYFAVFSNVRTMALPRATAASSASLAVF